jgi:phospholipid-binding lipoprotein MlaA
MSRFRFVGTLFVAVLLVVACDPIWAEVSVPAQEPSDSALQQGFDDEFQDEPLGFPDPLEGVNRQTLRFNRCVDRWLLNPIASTYGFLMPAPAKKAVQRFFANLNAPVIMVNDLLQREWSDAGTTVSRFAINTTVGMAGLFDPAAEFGFKEHNSDFGQTLALYGVRSGPFLMLPILGPTCARDSLGGIVDLMFRPTTYFLGPGDQLLYTTLWGGSSGIVQREANADALRALEESSIDYYAALRNAYYQNRLAQIWRGREHHRESPVGETEEIEPGVTGACSHSGGLAGAELGDFFVHASN